MSNRVLDQAPPWQQITVDLHSLRDLAAAMRVEVETALRPGVGELTRCYAGGPAFGAASVSADLEAVRRWYADCLRATTDQLSAYVDAASVLADAAREVAARYGAADGLVAVSAAGAMRALGSRTPPASR